MIRYLLTMLAALTIALPVFGTQHGATPLTEGEVRKVDKTAKKITIKHEPIRNLDMPAMTMVFQVRDSEMLDRVAAGDKVKFEAQKVNGAFTVVSIEKAN